MSIFKWSMRQFYLAGKKPLLAKFVGLNDWQENTNIIKKAIKIVSATINKYNKIDKQLKDLSKLSAE